MGAARTSSAASHAEQSTRSRCSPAKASRGIVDQLSRTPESLAASFAACLRTVAHPKIVIVFDALLVVSPEHAPRVPRGGLVEGPARATSSTARLQIPGEEIVRGAGGIAEGMPEALPPARRCPKFRDGGLLIVHAGGGAGLFSAIIGGLGERRRRQRARHQIGRCARDDDR